MAHGRERQLVSWTDGDGVRHEGRVVADLAGSMVTVDNGDGELVEMFEQHLLFIDCEACGTWGGKPRNPATHIVHPPPDETLRVCDTCDPNPYLPGYIDDYLSDTEVEQSLRVHLADR